MGFPFIDKKASAHAAYEKMKHKEQNQAGDPGYHRRVLPYVGGKSHSYLVLHGMRDSGPRCGALYAILGLSLDGTSLLLCMCVRAVCGGQRSTPGLIPHARNSQVRLVSQRAPGTCCQHLPRAGIKRVCHHVWISSEEF